LLGARLLIWATLVGADPPRAQVTGTKEELVSRLTGAPPPAKKVKPPATVAGVPEHLLPLLDHGALHKSFADLTKALARIVDADWHDSYEETDQELNEYVEGLQPHLQARPRSRDASEGRSNFIEPCHTHTAAHLQAVLECCELPECGVAALARCNLVMVEIAESWRQMDGVPFRCSMEDSIRGVSIRLVVLKAEDAKEDDDDEAEDDDEDGEPNAKMYSRKAAIGTVWAELVQAAGARLAEADDEALKRIVKDALDYGVTDKELNGGSGVWRTEAGAARVSALLTNKAALSALPSRLAQVKHYRAIDRRFDGPKHRRTRDYDGDGCAQQ